MKNDVLTTQAVVAVVRNEAQSLAEWLAWQYAIGFNAVILLDNASTDQTRQIAQSFAPSHDIRVLDWNVTSTDYQTRAYQHAISQLGGEFDWLAFFDADEFLVLPPDISLSDSLARCAHAAAIGIPWAMFGSSGHAEQPPGLITENFLHRATPDFFPNRHIKSIIRPAAMRAPINAHVFDMQGDYVGLDGAKLAFKSAELLAEDPDYAAGKLHHYFVQSWAHWQHKLARGYHDTTRPEAEFFVYDQNQVFDESATRLAPAVKAILAARETPKRETCAVVLVVKNEAFDIAAWLAWYHVLGFDAAIVYDDNSDDGTWDILNQAARHQAIHLHRTPGDKTGRYEPRQEEAYRHALKTYRDTYDWLAFFDADEFLLLAQDAKIQDFLARFPATDAVCISWCNYGSSGHILKPALAPFDAYTWHGDENQPINRHVKSIIRPKAAGPAWQNVHCFDMPAHRTRLASGAPATWAQTPGIIVGNPNWQAAKLMHYQCRSMEHFVERMKLRPELAAIPDIWAGYDIKQRQSLVPAPLAAAARAHMAKLKSPPPEIATADLDMVFDIGMAAGEDTEHHRAPNFRLSGRVIGVEPDARRFAALTERFAADIAAGALKLYNYAPAARAGEIVSFTPPDGNTYPVLTIDWLSLTSRHGTPRHVKIAGATDPAFLDGMTAAQNPPEHITLAAASLADIASLHQRGYQSFQLASDSSSAQLPSQTGKPWIDFDSLTASWQNPAEQKLCHARRAPP